MRREAIVLGCDTIEYYSARPAGGTEGKDRPALALPIESKDWASGFAALRKRLASPGRRLDIRLRTPWIQLRRLTELPPVSDRDLVRLVNQHPSRFFRETGAALCTNAIWLITPGRHRPHRALAAAASLDFLERIEAAAHDNGWAETRIFAFEPESKGKVPLVTPEAIARAGKRRRQRFGFYGIGLLGCATLGVLGMLLNLRVEEHRIDQGLQALSQPAAALASLQERTVEMVSMMTAIERFRNQRDQALMLTARIGTSLPDSAVMSSLVIREDSTGEVSGHAHRALDVLAALERLGLERPVVQGSLVREPQGGRTWERFTLIFGDNR